jgi:autophagy-related protein 13
LSIDGDDRGLPYAHRSISLGADREAPTKSILQTLRGGDEEAVEAHDDTPPPFLGLKPGASVRAAGSSEAMGQDSGEAPSTGSLVSPSPSSPFGRRRYTGMVASSTSKGRTTPVGRERYAGAGGDAAVDTAAKRQSRAENDDDEPLLFVMSEMDAHSRKSLEEGRGGRGSGSGDKGSRRW